MKKVFLILALAFAGIFTANAQVWVGGGLGANLQKNQTGFTLAPEIGYMIPNTPFTLALGTVYNYQNIKEVGSSNALALEPYFRYAPCTIADKFVLFFDLTADINLIDATPHHAYAIMVQPGIAWMATDKWTAAFRFGKVGYDHNFYGTNGFLLNCDLAAPMIRIYYNF